MKISNIILWEKIDLKNEINSGIVEKVKEFDGESEGELPKITSTPFGMFQLVDFFNPMQQYEWHLCHTNFSLGSSFCEIIKEIPGVEKVLIISKYRFIVAFGKVFDEKHIKRTFYHTFNAISKSAHEKLLDIISMPEGYEKWALYFIDDENFVVISNADEDFDSRLKVFQEKLESQGGLLFKNE